MYFQSSFFCFTKPRCLYLSLILAAFLPLTLFLFLPPNYQLSVTLFQLWRWTATWTPCGLFLRFFKIIFTTQILVDVIAHFCNTDSKHDSEYWVFDLN